MDSAVSQAASRQGSSSMSQTVRQSVSQFGQSVLSDSQFGESVSSVSFVSQFG